MRPMFLRICFIALFGSLAAAGVRTALAGWQGAPDLEAPDATVLTEEQVADDELAVTVQYGAEQKPGILRTSIGTVAGLELFDVRRSPISKEGVEEITALAKDPRSGVILNVTGKIVDGRAWGSAVTPEGFAVAWSLSPPQDDRVPGTE